MSSNIVITMARQYGSGGRTIGEELAKKLGISYYDKDIIRMASEESGIHEQLFGRADENVSTKQRFFAKSGIYKGELIPPQSKDFTSDENLFNYQAKVLKELALNESYICVGRAADFVLKDNPNLVSVFIYAPMDVCIDREAARNGIDKAKAKQNIIKTDKYRRGFYKYHTGREWESPYNYDLCLNTGLFTYEQCVDIIMGYINTRFKTEQTGK